MKSRITIEVDFDNGNQPVIQILSRVSDDVRDNLIKSFYQKLGGSSWCKIIFMPENFTTDFDFSGKKILITPIPDSELKTEAEIMLEQFKLREDWVKSNS